MNETFTIWGSDDDLRAFEKTFKDGGFDKYKDDPIPSFVLPGTETMGTFPPVPSIKYDITPGIGNCIKNILSTRHQRLVASQKNIAIKSDLSADEIERLLKCSRYYDIQNEAR
jgi:hypothetical protein